MIQVVAFLVIIKLLLGRCYDNPTPDDAEMILEWHLPGDVEVFQIRVRYPNGILAPMVTEGFQVAIVVVLTILFDLARVIGLSAYSRAFFSGKVKPQ